MEETEQQQTTGDGHNMPALTSIFVRGLGDNRNCSLNKHEDIFSVIISEMN